MAEIKVSDLFVVTAIEPHLVLKRAATTEPTGAARYFDEAWAARGLEDGIVKDLCNVFFWLGIRWAQYAAAEPSGEKLL